MKVADLTVEELNALIREAVTDVLSPGDPDAGLRLRPEVEARLREQLANPGPTVDMDELFAKLGFDE